VAEVRVDGYRIPPARNPERRSLDERVALLSPRLTRPILGAINRILPLGSRLRRLLLSRLIQRGYAALSRADWEMAIHLLYAPDATVDQPLELPGLDQQWRGWRAIEAGMDAWIDPFGAVAFVPIEVRDARHRLVVRLSIQGTGARSGATTGMEFFQAMWLDGAVIAR
jgi:SnoaL-like protein